MLGIVHRLHEVNHVVVERVLVAVHVGDEGQQSIRVFVLSFLSRAFVVEFDPQAPRAHQIGEFAQALGYRLEIKLDRCEDLRIGLESNLGSGEFRLVGDR